MAHDANNGLAVTHERALEPPQAYYRGPSGAKILPFPPAPRASAEPPETTDRASRITDADALRRLARAHGVTYSVFVAEELDAMARLRTVGYELELAAPVRPLLQVWHGTAVFGLIGDALERLAAAVTRGLSDVGSCRPTVLPLPQLVPGEATLRLRVGLYHHDHALDGASCREQPCVRQLAARLAELSVVPAD